MNLMSTYSPVTKSIGNTVWLNLTEDEILNMSCAIVEAFQIPGSKLYATKYTEPGMQDAATPKHLNILFYLFLSLMYSLAFLVLSLFLLGHLVH